MSCGPAEPTADLTPYSGQPATATTDHGFTVGADGSGAPCPAPLPFAPIQSDGAPSPALAGAYSTFALGFARGDGQQYLSQVATTLPPGLLGAISSVPLCAEPQANSSTCPAASEIGAVAVAAGAGPEPYIFTGHVFLTGPYDGAPYGLSIVVPAVIGAPTPLYNFGDVVTRAAIDVGLYSARVTVTSTLPTIVEGVPLRLQSLDIAVDRKDFLFNPTNCAALATESLLTGFMPGSSATATQSLSSPFQVGECGKLAFTPKLTASTGAKTSKADGASIEVKITQSAHQANLHEVLLQLPKRLPSRLTTLHEACPAATFEVADPPGACSSNSRIGSVTVSTPVLPEELSGPVYLVSHGGAAFPDVDMILKGDGLEVVLVGHTHISSSGITTSSFETLPDVPFSSAVVDLPIGPHSALGAIGRLCGTTLTAPTTLVAQSGAKLTQKTRVTVVGCPRKRHQTRHLRHRRKRRKAHPRHAAHHRRAT